MLLRIIANAPTTAVRTIKTPAVLTQALPSVLMSLVVAMSKENMPIVIARDAVALFNAPSSKADSNATEATNATMPIVIETTKPMLFLGMFLVVAISNANIPRRTDTAVVPLLTASASIPDSK